MIGSIADGSRSLSLTQTSGSVDRSLTAGALPLMTGSRLLPLLVRSECWHCPMAPAPDNTP